MLILHRDLLTWKALFIMISLLCTKYSYHVMVIFNILVFGWKPKIFPGKHMENVWIFWTELEKDIICRLQKLEYMGFREKVAVNVADFNTFKCQPQKMVKHTQTIRRLLPTKCLSVFDHFMGLVFKGLISSKLNLPNPISFLEV